MKYDKWLRANVFSILSTLSFLEKNSAPALLIRISILNVFNLSANDLISEIDERSNFLKLIFLFEVSFIRALTEFSPLWLLLPIKIILFLISDPKTWAVL